MTIKKLYHKPLLFDYQGSLTGESVQHGFVAGDGVMAGLFGRVEAMIDRGADAIVVSSEHLADPLRKRGLPAEAVPDWVDTDLFSPGPPDLSLSRELGLPEGVPVIVYLGVMSDYQGVDILLNAALELKENKVPFHLLAMGYPEVGYANLAGSLGLGGEMTFTGRVNYFEACRHLRLGRVAVAPKLSRTESNGKMLNYLACGLPAVAFDLPVNRDIAGESALYVQPDDDRDTCASALAAALQKLLEDRGLADKLGREGRQRALDRLSAQVLGDRLISAYGRLLEGRT